MHGKQTGAHAASPTVTSVLSGHSTNKDEILSTLHDLQARVPGKTWITDEELAQTARHFGVPVAELDGIVSFYTMFSRARRGEHIIRLCDSLSCRICGSLDLYHHLRTRLGISRGMTTGDQKFTLEVVNCLGACSTSPNMMVDDQLVSGLSVQEVDELIDELSGDEK